MVENYGVEIIRQGTVAQTIFINEDFLGWINDYFLWSFFFLRLIEQKSIIGNFDLISTFQWFQFRFYEFFWKKIIFLILMFWVNTSWHLPAYFHFHHFKMWKLVADKAIMQKMYTKCTYVFGMYTKECCDRTHSVQISTNWTCAGKTGQGKISFCTYLNINLEYKESKDNSIMSYSRSFSNSYRARVCKCAHRDHQFGYYSST